MRPVIAYPGVAGSFSESAAQCAFPQGETRGYATFAQAAEAAQNGAADYALLPVENSSTGSIRQVYDLLAQYPVEERFGGRVQALGGNVYHVCRGSVLELEEKKYLCFGGAESQDREDREPGVNWWKEEMPSDEEYAFCEENLAACDYKVDYVLTHDAPSRFLDFTALASGEANQLHSFLDKILLKLTYDKWFFGCYHKDTQLSTKSRCVFCDVISMGERHAKRSVR